MIMLSLEFALFLAFTTADPKFDSFFRYWQAVELGVVAAYFGARA